MKHTRFEENILVDESYGGGGRADRSDQKKSTGIAQHFADSLEQYDERKKWYHQLPQEPVAATRTLSEQQVEELRKEASSALYGDTLAYENKASKSGSSEQQWARTLMKKGAVGDRVAAATVLIQDSPLYNLPALRSLVASVKPAKKKDGIAVIDALSELFVSELLVPEVRLRGFEEHALAHLDDITSGNRHARSRTLELWHFEHQLRELYAGYVEALNVFAHDSVEANKEKAVSAMSYLIMHHPEKEKVLLKNIINKLGDPAQAVASKVIYHLCQLLYNHPNMKAVVLAEIEKMLFRKNISPRAQYYGVCFLNQFHLGKDDGGVADSLIRIYFSFFKASIKKGEIDSRLMSAILTGVRRAYPFAERARSAEAESAQHVAAVQRIVHLGNFNVAVHALALLYHISDASENLTDRYYTALYRKLCSAEVLGSSMSALLFSLLYKSLRRDSNTARVAAFAKRCAQLATHMQPAQACGMLFLLSQVTKDKEKKNAIKLEWNEEEVKEEPEPEPAEPHGEAAAADASQVKAEEPCAKDMLRGNKLQLLDDSEEEYVDLQLDAEGNVRRRARTAPRAPAGWLHRQLQQPAADHTPHPDLDANIQLRRTINKDRVATEYSALARNPAHAGAQHAVCAELLTLAAHFHPSVRLFAQKLLHGQLIQYGGDPLKDFSGVRFLDRFAFKNPKKRSEAEAPDETEGAVRRVKGSHPKFALRKNYTAKGLKSLPVTSASYLNEHSDKIPVDELFLYRYLRERRDAAAAHERGEGDEGSDAESVTSEDFDAYLDRLTGARYREEEEEALDFMSEVRGGGEGGAGARADSGGGGESSEGEPAESADEDELSADEDELVMESEEEGDGGRTRHKRAKELVMESEEEGDGGRTRHKRAKGGGESGSLFASAEEFSSLLEETAAEARQGSSGAAAARDRAPRKQLAWEERRHTWLRGYARTVRGGGGGGGGGARRQRTAAARAPPTKRAKR